MLTCLRCQIWNILAVHRQVRARARNDPVQTLLHNIESGHAPAPELPMPYRYQIWKEPDVLNSDHDAHHTNVSLRVSHPVGPVHLQGTAAVVCGIAMKPALDRVLMDLLNLPLEAVQARFAEQMTINIHSQLYKGHTLSSLLLPMDSTQQRHSQVT